MTRAEGGMQQFPIEDMVEPFHRGSPRVTDEKTCQPQVSVGAYTRKQKATETLMSFKRRRARAHRQPDNGQGLAR
jgi:hypothetical protein